MIYFFLFLITTSLYSKQFTIMIDPAGDAKNPGRTIDDYFERGITLSFANALKQELENKSQARVIITRLPGEIVDSLQNANFANRLPVDLYVSLNFFSAKETRSPLFIYYFVRDAITDEWQQIDSASFISFENAHLYSLKITKKIVNQLADILKEKQAECSFVLQGPFGIPFKPLVGITAPAFGIEIGLAKANDWKSYVEPIVFCLNNILKQQQN